MCKHFEDRKEIHDEEKRWKQIQAGSFKHFECSQMEMLLCFRQADAFFMTPDRLQFQCIPL